MVTTFAGSGVSGGTDGSGVAALIGLPVGIFIDSNGVMFVTHSSNSLVRRITSAGSN